MPVTDGFTPCKEIRERRSIFCLSGVKFDLSGKEILVNDKKLQFKVLMHNCVLFDKLYMRVYNGTIARLVCQAVKTLPSHGRIRSSSLLRVTK